MSGVTIFPPILSSTQSAFSTNSNLTIKFSLYSGTSASTVKHLQIRVVSQRSNESVVNTAKFPDGVIYLNLDNGLTSGVSSYEVTIKKEYLDGTKAWKAGVCYKIQLRYGTNKYDLTDTNFAAWKKAQIDKGAFSEWSTVMVVKAITPPQVKIQNKGVFNAGTSSTVVESTLTPLFTGLYSDIDSNEPLMNYKFELRDKEGETLIETSDWIAATSSQCTHRFKTILTNEEYYNIRFYIQTKNGYTAYDSLDIQVNKVYLKEIQGVKIAIVKDIYCQENGCMRIYLTANESITGTYVLSRTSEKSNYSVFEDLQTFKFLAYKNENSQLLYTDFTIESGVKYQYNFQYQNSQGLRTTPILTGQESVDFEYAYLFRDGKQLKLSLNSKISSFKHTTLVQKQDTLGSQFPSLSKNGYAYYAEFSLSGLISFQMDEDQTFFTLGTDGYYYNSELIIPEDKFSVSTATRGKTTTPSYLPIDTSITDNNIFVERKFREKVESFLNDFTYKLYKSPTEGNIVIGLTNISLTPETSLGRMIYNFSATAYEIAENGLENLNENGIIDIDEEIALQKELSQETFKSFGQIAGAYTSTVNEVDIYALIKKQEEVVVDNSYRNILQQVDSFWIETYPTEGLENYITTLKAKQNGEKNEKVLEELRTEQALYEAIESACTPENLNTAIKIKVNGSEVLVNSNKIYNLKMPITSFSLVSAPYPLIINYTCTLDRDIDDTTQVIKQLDSSKVWGQISGVFTNNDTILKQYYFNYGPGELPYRVYSGRSNPILDSLGRILIDHTDYNVYKTLDLMEVIKEDTRKQIELMYQVQEGFIQSEMEGEWVNKEGTIQYSFSSLVSIDIEADPYTVLIANYNNEGESVKINIGPTGRYVLSPIDDQEITSLKLESPEFVIVNYRCTTSQRILEGAD